MILRVFGPLRDWARGARTKHVYKEPRALFLGYLALRDRVARQ